MVVRRARGTRGSGVRLEADSADTYEPSTHRVLPRTESEGKVATRMYGALPLPMTERVSTQTVYRRIAMIEAQRSMSSEQFMKAFRAGEEPETPENVEWARLVTISERLRRH